MESFVIKSTTDDGFLEFFGRSPQDQSQPIHSFSIRVFKHSLSALASVYAGETSTPTTLFEAMARDWTGWPGERLWESLEGELRVCCTHDRLGHIGIRIELRSGSYESDWSISATVMTEAGQLESIARQAAEFFGQPARPWPGDSSDAPD